MIRVHTDVTPTNACTSGMNIEWARTAWVTQLQYDSQLNFTHRTQLVQHTCICCHSHSCVCTEHNYCKFVYVHIHTHTHTRHSTHTYIQVNLTFSPSFTHTPFDPLPTRSLKHTGTDILTTCHSNSTILSTFSYKNAIGPPETILTIKLCSVVIHFSNFLKMVGEYY